MKQNWCDRHWQPYREGKAPGIVATMLLFQHFVDSEDVQRKCGWNPETGQMASTERLQQVSQELSPICCYLGDTVMDQIFLEAATMGATKQ